MFIYVFLYLKHEFFILLEVFLVIREDLTAQDSCSLSRMLRTAFKGEVQHLFETITYCLS